MATVATAASNDQNQYLIFMLGKEAFAIPILFENESVILPLPSETKIDLGTACSPR